MAKIERKSLAQTLKKDMKDRQSKKGELADKVFEKLESREVVKKEKQELQSKLTVMIPQSYHDKLKRRALDEKKKIREMVIEFIESL